MTVTQNTAILSKKVADFMKDKFNQTEMRNVVPSIENEPYKTGNYFFSRYKRLIEQRTNTSNVQ